MPASPTLRSVRAPHAVDRPEVMPALIAAYQDDQPVTPVVVIIWPESRPFAVCGSHRLAALREVYEEETDLETLAEAGYVLVYDGEELALEHEHLLDVLAPAAEGRGGDYGTICEQLRECLDEAGVAALEDQV